MTVTLKQENFASLVLLTIFRVMDESTSWCEREEGYFDDNHMQEMPLIV